MSDPYNEERTPLIIEFTKTPEEGLVPVRAVPPRLEQEELPKLEEKSNKAMDKAMTIIQDIAKRVNSAINITHGEPHRVEIGFGIKFDDDVGVMLAKTQTEATLNVKLTLDNLGK
jgi:hypothetical protein